MAISQVTLCWQVEKDIRDMPDLHELHGKTEETGKDELIRSKKAKR